MVNVHIITEYCCHVSAVAANCYWDMLVMLLKQLCRNAGLSRAVSLEPLVRRRQVASVLGNTNMGITLGNTNMGITLVDASEVAELVLIPYSRGRPT